jgi:hypothetical protein
MAPFSTFFGDYLHGLWVTWESNSDGNAQGTTGFRAHFQANYRARMYTWTTTTTAPDASKDYDFTNLADDSTPMTDGATWDVDKYFMFYVAWSNPNSAESVTKDGIYLLAKCVLVAGATIATDEPTLTCAYTALDSDGTTTHVNDIKPVANYDSATSVYDATDDITTDTTLQDTTLSGNLCSESWYLGGNSLACVEMQAGAYRAFSTGDTDGDFILDYVEYAMHAKFGEINDTDDVFRFAEQTVNFNDLLASETNFSMLGF